METNVKNIEKPILLNQFVQTPREITEVLMRFEKFDGDVLEPCCGMGAISEVVKQTNHVISCDKNDYGYGVTGVDLFGIRDKYDNIITNPPFIQQSKVKRHLLKITKRKLALLWYLKNLGNEVETKQSQHLKSVYVFNQKINWVETKLGWKFAWYVWDKEYEGDIIIKKIDLPKAQTKLFI